MGSRVFSWSTILLGLVASGIGPQPAPAIPLARGRADWEGGKIEPAVMERASSEDHVPVILVLREQPFGAVAAQVKSLYLPRIGEARSRIAAARGLVETGWGDPVPRRLRAAPRTAEPSRGTMLTLLRELEDASEEMRGEMWRRGVAAATPQLEALASAVEAAGGIALNRIESVSSLAAVLPGSTVASIAALPEVGAIVISRGLGGHLAQSVTAIGAPVWWETGGIIGDPWDVGVIDTGVDSDHPDLVSGNRFASQKVFHTALEADPGLLGCAICVDTGLGCCASADCDTTPNDRDGHGTQIAGVLCASQSAVPGSFSGVAYTLDSFLNAKAGARILCSATAFDAFRPRHMLWPDAADALEWVVFDAIFEWPDGAGDLAEAVNFSYGDKSCDYLNRDYNGDWFAQFCDAVIHFSGIPVAMAAGNEHGRCSQAATLTSPATGFNSICVGGINDQGTINRADDTGCSFSSRGPTSDGRKKPDLVAPAENIYTTTTGDGWGYATGTSFAAPHVTGALLLLRDYGITEPEEQKALLINTADDWPPGAPDGWDSRFGWGYVNLDSAWTHRDQVFFARTDNPMDGTGGPIRIPYYSGVLKAGDRVTIAWDLPLDYLDYDGYESPEQPPHDPSATAALPDLDLLLYDDDTGELLASSSSTVDNVEQVAAPRDVDHALVEVHDQHTGHFAYALAHPGTLQAGLADLLIAPVSIFPPPRPGAPFFVTWSFKSTASSPVSGVTPTLAPMSAGLIVMGGPTPSGFTLGPGDSIPVSWQLLASSPGLKPYRVEAGGVWLGNPLQAAEMDTVEVCSAPLSVDPARSAIASLDSSYLLCPAGDGEAAPLVRVTCRNAVGAPLPGIPAAQFDFEITGSCSTGTAALFTVIPIDAVTDAAGILRARFQAPACGASRCSLEIGVRVSCSVLQQRAALAVQSTDLDGDCDVDLVDLVDCGSPADAALLAPHFGHGTPSGHCCGENPGAHWVLDFDLDGDPATINPDTTAAPGSVVAARIVALDPEGLTGIEFTLDYPEWRLTGSSYSPDAALPLLVGGSFAGGVLHAAQARGAPSCLPRGPRFAGEARFVALDGGNYSAGEFGFLSPSLLADCSRPPRTNPLSSATSVGSEGVTGSAPGDSPASAAAFTLGPQPSGRTIDLGVDVPGPGALVRAEIFAVTGRRVRTLAESIQPPGRHVVSWDGRDEAGESLSSGLYFCRVSVGSWSGMLKLVLTP